jgi:hypothetical protein
MSFPLGRRAARAVAATALTLAATAGFAAMPAQADVLTAHPLTAQSGSGTLSDPWVPTRAAHITCSSATLFGNYSPGAGHSDPIDTLPQDAYIGVRYITSNNYSADVFWHGKSKWGFLLRSCFALN